MKVTMDNQTGYDTRRLRTLVRRACRQMMAERDKHVIVRYRRHGQRVLGRARYGVLNSSEARTIWLFLERVKRTYEKRPLDASGKAVCFHVEDGVQTAKVVQVDTLIERIEGDDLRELANTVLHEIAHTQGLSHRHMGGRCVGGLGRWATGDYSWLGDLTVIERISAQQPSRGERVADLVAKREDRARQHLKEHELRLRREQKLVRKWRQKVRYYEQKRVAATCGKPRADVRVTFV